MWIFRPNGHVSIVAHDRDRTKVIVRGRYRKHVAAFLSDGGLRRKIQRTPTADYEYRVGLRRDELATALVRIAMSMTQTNVKAATAEEGDATYTGVMHGVYAAASRLDRRPVRRLFDEETP